VQMAMGVRGGRVLGGVRGGAKGGGLGGGWAVVLLSARARREGKKDFGWEGQEVVQQQKMPADAQSLVLTR